MADRPNVLMVLSDQLRRQALGCAGDPNVSTPAIDSLAEDGVRCTNACSNYPVCVPARFSLLTGEHPHSREIPAIDWAMSPTERTMGDAFSDAGYETAYIGKWHLSGHHAYRLDDEVSQQDRMRWLNRSQVPPAVRDEFDYWRGFELRNHPFDTAYFVDDDPEPQSLDGYQTDGLFELAREFLTQDRDSDRPFFLILSVEPPHPPFAAPDEYERRWAGRELTLRPNVPYDDPDMVPPTHESWGSREAATASFEDRPVYFRDTVLDEMRGYYAMVENLDDNVGELVETLEQNDMRASTALLFLADHGELLGSHGLMAKQYPYEESVGIPAICSYPEGGIDGGRTVSEPVGLEDWFPTLLSIAGIKSPSEMPGADIRPLLADDESTLDRDGVLLEFVREDRSGRPFDKETWRGLHTGRYKYTVKGGMYGAEPWQLFDLEEDPYEQHNLLEEASDQQLAERLHGTLRTMLDDTDDTFPLQPAFGHPGLNMAEWN
jgi:arylsulfatase A-like enzyme